MQHRRPRLMAKILAFVLAVSLVFPVSIVAQLSRQKSKIFIMN